MNIGFLASALTIEQQRTLLDEGHVVHVALCGYYNSVIKDVCPINHTNYKFLNEGAYYKKPSDYYPMLDEMASYCDFFVFDYNGKWLLPLAQYLRSIGASVIGPTDFTNRLEYDREFGKLVATNISSFGTLNSGVFCKTPEEALDYVQDAGLCVLKGRDVTLLPRHVDECIDLIQNDPFGYFRAVRTGLRTFETGVYLEQHVEGEELAFGRWFDGATFTGFAFVNREYKGSHNSNMSGVLTGESGTVAQMVPATELPPTILRAFETLAPYLSLHKYSGFIDINTITSGKGKDAVINFLEWTTRWGYPTENQLISFFRANRLSYGNFLCDLALGRLHQNRKYYYRIYKKPYLVSAALLHQTHDDAKVSKQLEAYKQKVYGLDNLKGVDATHFGTFVDASGAVRVQEHDRAMVFNAIASDLPTAHKLLYRGLQKVYSWSHYYREDIGNEILDGGWQKLLKKVTKAGGKPRGRELESKNKLEEINFSDLDAAGKKALLDRMYFLDTEAATQYGLGEDFVFTEADVPNNTDFLLLQSEDALEAYAAVSKKARGKGYELISIAVSPRYSYRGIGKDLVNILTENPKYAEGLTLQCSTALIPYYEGCGFKLTKKDPGGMYNHMRFQRVTETAS